MDLWILAIGPTLTFLGYLYVRNSCCLKTIRIITLVYILGFLSPLITTYTAEILTQKLIPPTTGIWRSFVFAFGVIGLAEEGVKFAFLLPISLRTEIEEAEINPIISFGIAFSLGFATAESIIYVVFDEYFTSLITGVYRMLFTVPAHVIFGALMGCGLAYAKIVEKKLHKILYIFLALLLPILIHGSFDFLIDLKRNAAAYLLVPLVALLIKKFCTKIENIA